MDSLSFVLKILELAFATFVGAWFAFRLEAWKERKEEIERQVDHARRAQFALIAQQTLLSTVKAQALDPQADNPLNWLYIQPWFDYSTVPQLDTSSLSFFFKTADADLLNRLLLGQHAFNGAIGILKERNRVHTQLQERLSQWQREHEFKLGGFTEEFLEEAVGTEVVRMLKDLTVEAYSSFEQALELNDKHFHELRVLMEGRFPKEPILQRIMLKPKQGNRESDKSTAEPEPAEDRRGGL